MGEPKTLKTYASPKRPVFATLPTGVVRTRPRAYREWKALRRWGKLPDWERPVSGYVLRNAREESGFTQSELAGRLGVSQQAIAQAERSTANPSVDFIRRWADACGVRFVLELPRDATENPPRKRRSGGNDGETHVRRPRVRTSEPAPPRSSRRRARPTGRRRNRNPAPPAR